MEILDISNGSVEFIPFWPERGGDVNPGWGFVPFGGGPQLCIGRECMVYSRLAVHSLVIFLHSRKTDHHSEIFALTEATHGLIRILQSFEAIEAQDVNEGRREPG